MGRLLKQYSWTQLDVGYTNRNGSKAEFFSARMFFKGVGTLVGRVRNIQLFKF